MLRRLTQQTTTVLARSKPANKPVSFFLFKRNKSTMSVSETVQTLINENPVMVFSKSYCPYCTKVKNLFKSLGVSYKVIELDEEGNGDAIQAELKKISHQSTVPNVYIGKTHVGGCDDTHAAKANGKLKTLLDSAGVKSNL
eukprot:TRINITY_DN692_c0_g1_i1.p1 TRINITY_DN692_c0_g1~~TRINITY_DN692_c0_g1_i1.p1  ORF type:complete len:141 (+),score=29.74 TRINITY_DN692_c0_g1_i1:32-454(+)